MLVLLLLPMVRALVEPHPLLFLPHLFRDPRSILDSVDPLLPFPLVDRSEVVWELERSEAVWPGEEAEGDR